MYLNEILPGNWREDEWPEHIEVSHESSRFMSRSSTASRRTWRPSARSAARSSCIRAEAQ